MTPHKEPIDPERIRRLPRGGFSWVDRRFLREGWCSALPREASLLYFFLAAVSDARGLSYYSDGAIGRHLDLDRETLLRSRAELVRLGLILYRDPLYQVLPIPGYGAPAGRARPRRRPRLGRGDPPVSLGEILREAFLRTRDRGPRDPHGS